MKFQKDEELARLVETSADRLHAHVASVIRDNPAVKAALQRDQNPAHHDDQRKRAAG
jgi:hypothetical protein